MTEPVLWPLESHTAAKHQVLRAYLDGWIGVMAHQSLRSRLQNPRLLLVDGFAGPGRYEGGELGSPLIMLEALLTHKYFEQFAAVEFIFLFIEHDHRRIAHLRGEIEALDELPPNVKYDVIEGEFEQAFGSVIDPIVAQGGRLIPTFAFIDPFGYTSATMSITGRLLDFPRCEMLFFLPMSFIHRFVGMPEQEPALNGLFGTEEWKKAIPLEGSARSDFLIELFEAQIESSMGAELARSFQLRTTDGNDYRLVFGLGHLKGLELAKDAMWKVDPVAGTSYAATTQAGQDVLFGGEATLDTAPLLAELRAKFGTEWFSIDQADKCTLVDTPYRKAHLRTKTLGPAERDGVIEVKRKGPHGFKDAEIRFKG